MGVLLLAQRWKVMELCLTLLITFALSPLLNAAFVVAVPVMKLLAIRKE
jgi:hypothetical protein